MLNKFNRYLSVVACFMFKVHNGLMPSYFANVFL